ncbi:MAG: mechanosensitive ion channel [Gammaproteobacteria bacterium]|nr:mechanosensitive ion channel [Gammaproteobacteria bacterium]
MDLWNYPLVALASGEYLLLGQLVGILLALLAGLLSASWLSRLVARQLKKAQVAPNTVHLVRRLIYYALLLMLALTLLALLHIPLTALAFLSGGIAIGVGFGAQALINNFLSGWILMSERPVRIGDFIEVGESQGTVENIGNRSTRVRRVDGVHMLIPNSLMLEQTVVNWTLIDRDIRTRVRVGVAYGSPVRQVEEILRRSVTEHNAVKVNPPPLVVFEDFGDSSLVFDMFFWCAVSGERELRLVRSDIRYRITELFEEAGITISFPQRDVHLLASTPVPVRISNANEGETDA